MFCTFCGKKLGSDNNKKDNEVKTTQDLHKKEVIKIIKFVIIGFVGYFVNAFSLAFFTNMRLTSPLAWGLSTELAIINNFILNNLWTFKTEKIIGFIRLFTKIVLFNVISIGALLIETVFGSLSDTIFGAIYRQTTLPFIILVFVLPYNYFMYNTVIWKAWRFPLRKVK